MSFSNNIAARGGLHGWITAGGHNRGGISRAGKIYLPVDPASNTTARADAHNAEAVDSKLPKAEASSAAGQLPLDGNKFPNGYECRCGRQKLPKHLVCHSCWQASPDALRKELRFGNKPTRRAALRLLLGVAGARKELRNL